MDDNPTSFLSYLPATAEIINLFISSLQHLVLDININGISASSDLNEIDFSPLDDLGTASALIPRIDLYVRTGISVSALRIRDQLLSTLEDYENIANLIKGGILVIHSEKSAPDWV